MSMYRGLVLHSPCVAQVGQRSSASRHGILNGSASKQTNDDKSSSIGKHSVFVSGSEIIFLESVDDDEDDDAADTVAKQSNATMTTMKSFTDKVILQIVMLFIMLKKLSRITVMDNIMKQQTRCLEYVVVEVR